MKEELKLKVNGFQYTLHVEPELTLLEVLRNNLGLTGTKSGCEMGECGACTVLIDGKAINSCLVLAHDVDGQEIITIEGIADGGELHPIQKSFIENGAIQCGFCTPGMIITAKGFLDKNESVNEAEIKKNLVGNLCRCTGYTKIIKAVLTVNNSLKEENHK